MHDILGPPTPKGRKICYYSGLTLLCWMSFTMTIAIYWQQWFWVAVKAVAIGVMADQLIRMQRHYKSNGDKW